MLEGVGLEMVMTDEMMADAKSKNPPTPSTTEQSPRSEFLEHEGYWSEKFKELLEHRKKYKTLLAVQRDGQYLALEQWVKDQIQL